MDQTPNKFTQQSQRYMQHLVGNRKMAIAAGAILTILGILFFIFPLASVWIAGLFIIIGLIIYGVYLIFAFITAPPHFRDGWQLTQGIIMLVCAVLVVLPNGGSIVSFVAFLLGFLAMMIGVNEIIAYSSLKGTQGAGFILASGIINILLALFLILAPYLAAATIGIVQGIYLCFAGIALIIEGFAKRPTPLDM